jgi:hypothetical protein
MAVEKTLRLESTNAFHFSTATTTDVREVLPRSAEERRGRKEQPNGATENLMAKMRP